jgi:hypothetical protein
MTTNVSTAAARPGDFHPADGVTVEHGHAAGGE